MASLNYAKCLIENIINTKSHSNANCIGIVANRAFDVLGAAIEFKAY
jgi:hypothetical protein